MAKEYAIKPDEEQEKAEEKKEKENEKEKILTIPYSKLFMFAKRSDKLMIAGGAFCAILTGLVYPLFSLIFGGMIDAFADPTMLWDNIKKVAFWSFGIGAGALFTGYGQEVLFNMSANAQARRIRKAFVSQCLRQECGWFDLQKTGEVSSHIASDIPKIQTGISDELGRFIQFMSMFVGGFVIGFIKGPLMALVMCAVSPLMIISGVIIAKAMASFTSAGQAAYASAGAIAHEVFSSIRTVTSFGTEYKEYDRYDDKLKAAMKQDIKSAFSGGFALGFSMFLMFGTYALGFWFGALQVEKGNMTAGDVFAVFFAITIGASALGYINPPIVAFTTAMGSGHHIFSVIERKTKIDPYDTTLANFSKASFEKCITFDSVKMIYPSRPEAVVLENFCATIKKGSKVAFVGSSGCGKSTVANLLARFYNPVEGSVLIDGNNIAGFNPSSFRAEIGYVSQEPVLFATTIRNNILYGFGDDEFDETDDSILDEVCKIANAYNFIQKLPEKYDTLVGERGVQLSGGQKQRIAIARALIKDPSILILDEATSALDTESEKLVQEAIDRISGNEGRTSIIIAHRLATVRNVDIIFVFSQGKVIETGNHEELLAKRGKYYRLIEKQNVDKKQANVNIVDDESLKTKTDFVGEAEETKDLTEKKTLSFTTVIKRAMVLNKPEWGIMFIGLLASVITGLSMPSFAFSFSEMANALIFKTGEELDDAVRLWSLIFVAIAFAVWAGHWGAIGLFGKSGIRLTRRIRLKSFKTLLRQDMEYFDRQENLTGSLTTRLAQDADQVKKASGETLAQMFSLIVTLVGGMAIGYANSWQISLAMTIGLPLIGLAGALEMKVMMGTSEKTRLAYEVSGQIASEAVDNIRTVLALNRNSGFVDLYSKSLEGPYRIFRKNSHLQGFAFGFSQSMLMIVYGCGYLIGGYLVDNGYNTFDQMMKGFMGVMFAGMMIGQMAAMFPNITKATVAASNVFKDYDITPKKDPYSEEGRKGDILGKITFGNVVFRYPSRKKVTVLDGLSFEANPGETVAIAGSSGCGKSTILSLLEQFYVPESGVISIDDEDINSYNVQSLRSQMALVAQEPILFDMTIAENIVYGCFSEVSQNEIEEAAKKARAYDFIVNLPQGFSTMVGEKGIQLSGGQKQRVAIARSIIRNPKILLLDEATSALDAESEGLVQEALQEASEGRTTIVVAHRLSTIKNADNIVVLHEGKVVESGKHDQLLQKGGMYAKLVQQQIGIQ